MSAGSAALLAVVSCAACLLAAACTSDYELLATGAGAAGTASSASGEVGGGGRGGESDGGASPGSGGAAAAGPGVGAGGTGGSSDCPEGTKHCDGDATCDALDIEGNCGQCGVTCGEDWACAGLTGCACVADTACAPADRTDEAGCDETSGRCVCDRVTKCNVGETCVDDGSDNWNLCTCGETGAACAEGAACVNGACVL